METERLVLRKFDSCDAEFLYQLNNDKIVNKYRSSDSMPMEKCVDSINGWKEKYDGKHIFGVYIITLRSDSTPIGLIAVVGREGSDKAELGYRLMPQYWGMGYCKEAAKSLIDRVFEYSECTMVYAETHPGNSNSVNLLFSLGFKELKNDVEGSGRLFFLDK